MRIRSARVVVHSSLDVKNWAERVPDVEACRPSHCPRCGAAARPLGGPLVLVGHGLRSRQVRGSLEAGAAPAITVLLVRRYRCRRCSGTTTVLPRGALAARHYGASAIAWACALYGMTGASLAATRARVSPWRSEEPGWPTLGRWLRSVEARALFPVVRPSQTNASARARAERVAATVLAFAPAGGVSLEARVFAGAPLAACA